MRTLSLAKFEKGITNEDAAIARNGVIAVSDGAGGGGVFAECWSKYLVEHLPDTPIVSYEAFDDWVDNIWEPFYNKYEERAKVQGGMFLNKFYDEGSFATLATVWANGKWMSYGDSVVFCYNKATGELRHSFTRLADFNNPPFLINCKDPLEKDGFRSGQFQMSDEDIIFAATDTLAHYILMMYEVTHKEQYEKELSEAVIAQTKNSNFVKVAINMVEVDFQEAVIEKLLNCQTSQSLKNYIKGILKKGLIGHDDYSLAIM